VKTSMIRRVAWERKDALDGGIENFRVPMPSFLARIAISLINRNEPSCHHWAIAEGE
jgi:hypothetical protein